MHSPTLVVIVLLYTLQRCTRVRCTFVSCPPSKNITFVPSFVLSYDTFYVYSCTRTVHVHARCTRTVRSTKKIRADGTGTPMVKDVEIFKVKRFLRLGTWFDNEYVEGEH
jgi:hypothetical protein